MDPAHEATEKIIKRLEKRIQAEYEQAVAEVQAKLDDYLRRFEKKDELKRRAVEKGQITKEEYEKWRIGQIAVGKRWEKMKQELAEDYHRANEIAKQLVRDTAPEVFAENFNYGTYEVEVLSQIDTSFTLYNKKAIERILKDNPELLPPPGKKVSELIAAGLDIRWNKQLIQSIIMQAILQGESISEIARRLAEAVGDSNFKAAIRNARTGMTGAQNAARVEAYKRAQELGIDMQQEWVATLDMRTRHSHRMMDGERIEVGGMFSNGCRYPGDPDGPAGETFNCFVGDMGVATDSEIQRSYKHEYKGELVTIETAGGIKFTCTPNHPILTPRGWISANLFNEGDDICVTFIGDSHSSGRNPHINHGFTRFDTIHEFMNESGGKRTCALGVNFHGDIATSDVEIVTLKGLLRKDRNTGEFEHKNELGLKNTDKSRFGKSVFMQHLGSIFRTSFSHICSINKSLPFLRGCLRHTKVHRFGSVSGSNVCITKYTIDNLPATTMIRSKLLDGLSGKVFVDNVISVNKISGSAHVYNLQTENGYYFVNSIIPNSGGTYNGNMGIIAKNCRCTLIGQLKGFEIDTRKYRTDPDFGGMSYEEWKKAKPKYNSITLPEEKAEAIKWSYIGKYRSYAK